MDPLLTIRQAQCEVLTADRVAQFESRVESSVRRHWAHAVENLDARELRERIHTAVQRAYSHGMAREADVLRYVNLTFCLGERFDEDPRYPWAAAFLKAAGVPSSTRMDQLCGWVQTLIGRGQL